MTIPGVTNYGLSPNFSCLLSARSSIDTSHCLSTSCRRYGVIVRQSDSSYHAWNFEASYWSLLLLPTDERFARHLSSRTHELWPTQWLCIELTMERKLEGYLRPDAHTSRMRQPSRSNRFKWRIHGFYWCVGLFWIPVICSS